MPTTERVGISDPVTRVGGLRRSSRYCPPPPPLTRKSALASVALRLLWRVSRLVRRTTAACMGLPSAPSALPATPQFCAEANAQDADRTKAKLERYMAFSFQLAWA